MNGASFRYVIDFYVIRRYNYKNLFFTYRLILDFVHSFFLAIILK